MRGLFVRFASAALCATALAGCSTLTPDTDHSNLATERADRAPANALDVAASVHQAQALRTQGDLDGATRILSQLMLAAPDDPRVVSEYGKLLVEQGHTGDAVQFLNRAIQLQPSDWTYYSALGVAYDQMGDRNNAKLAYERALILKPNEPAVLNNFAMSRMLAGDTATARVLMARAQASGSTDPKIAANLELLNKMASAPVVAPHTAAASTAPAEKPAKAHPAAPSTAAAGATPSERVAKAAPQPITNGKPVVMQQVPVDPLAGPVKTTKTAKADKTKPAKDQIPALRMAADASKP
jgi:Flp pilus assembly protein TadD